MPLRRLTLTCCLLFSLPTGAQDTADYWLDDSAVEALPEAARPALQPWCSGTWFNPAFATEPETADTVITAGESSLTPDGLMSLSGEVEIRQPNRHLSASEAWLDQGSGEFTMRGDIRVETPQATLLADELKGNTRNRTATVSNTRYALFDLPARGNAGELRQSGDTLDIIDGSYTSCPPDSDVWLLEASRIELDKASGWGEAEDVILRVEKVPVLYLPWITFPIDDRRKTGLLFPSLSSSSSGGLDVIVPVYLNLHPQADATVAPRSISDRGNGVELEGRYLTLAGEGSLSYGLIANDRLFEDQDREVARWEHSGNLKRWQLTTDVNYVSDDFYFKDLDTGLDIAAQTHLPRQGEARYYGDVWNLRARVQTWQTIDPNLADEDLPYRRLPQIALNGTPTLLGPLSLDWESEWTAFERNVSDGVTNVTGDRVHLQPALQLTLANSWGYVTPRARLYQTEYRLDGVEPSGDRRPSRALGAGNIDAGLTLERALALGNRSMTQTLEPRLFLNYISYEEQDELPDFGSAEKTSSYAALFEENRFTGYDRIGDDRSATLGLTSRLMDRSNGSELATIRIAQRHYVADREVQLDGAPTATNTLSPLISDVTLRLNQHLNLFYENQWYSEENQVRSNRIRISYADDERRYLHAGYVERRDDRIEQAELGARVPVYGHWGLMGRWLYDVIDYRSLETMAGLEYRDCCWRMRLINQRELSDRNGDGSLEADNTILFEIQLIGLGGFGDNIDKLLERSVPGYRSRNER